MTNYILSKELGFDYKFFSISTAVKNDLKGYYDILERSGNLFYNRNFDFTEWILWHTNMINTAIDISLSNIKIVTDKTKFWDKAKNKSINEHQEKVIRKLLDAGKAGFEGGLTNKKYRAITKTSAATANRHIRDLLDKKILCEVEGHSGRSVCYSILWDNH
ncbi:MAG: Fic family protein [Epsilonproteobacteria bacterium]|nr:Fic family protein [Campylobacterota bacterium]